MNQILAPSAELVSPRLSAPRVAWLPAWVRSASFRFATVYAVLLALSTAALAFFLWWATAGLLERQTEAAIRADAQGLSERWMEGGLPALLLTIDDRLAQNVDDMAIYLIVGPDMHRLAGNVRVWPTGLALSGPSYDLPVQRSGHESLAVVQRFDLPGGFHMLVGRDMQVRGQLRRLLTDAILWAVGVIVALATAGGFVARAMFQRAISNVSATAAAIAGGDLSRRVRRGGRGDEFDQLADTINDMLDRIARLMDGVRQVSNAIAHDLRTPITRARARLEDAALHARTEADLRGAIERATTDLDSIVAVFQALLRIAEIEAGSRRSAFVGFDARGLLNGLADLFGAAAEERDLTLFCAALEPLPIHGDRDMIQQAISNLLDNAIKFSPPHATVRLGGTADATHVRIAVADEGPGIPVEERARATERFFRGETARSTPGAGLGLALVQAVAHLHGGTLRLDDAAPGLRATLVLPRDLKTPSAGWAREAEPEARPPGRSNVASST